MKILLVSNYILDRQESMLRFSALLHQAFIERGHQVESVRPTALFGGLLRRRPSFAKWGGYVDKLMLFPISLRRKSAKFDVAHLCDHSNATYRPWLKSRSVVATCHDLLAVRGALGEETYCPATSLGRRLQSSILRNLAEVPYVACDSDATRADFIRLTGRTSGPSLRTIRLGFSASFRRPSDDNSRSALANLGLDDCPFIFHVGSSQTRKNREGILRMVGQLGDQWTGRAVFAGERLSSTQRGLASELGIAARVRDLGGVPDETLAALYAGAHALVFPSLCEGFGWPILEAQACGCPVITADNSSLAEVAGSGAILFAARDLTGMARAIVRLADPEYRRDWIARGFANVERFSLQGMIDAYENLYREALSAC